MTAILMYSMKFNYMEVIAMRRIITFIKDKFTDFKGNCTECKRTYGYSVQRL